MRHTWAERGLGIMAGGLLALAGCSDGGGTTTAGPTTASDKEAATKILLTADDVPGFVTLRKPSNWPPVYAECAEDSLLPGNSSAHAEPTSFYRDDTAVVRRVQVDGVESYAVLAETEDDARQTIAAVADPAFRQCVQEGIEVAQEGTVENEQILGSSVVDLETPGVGDESSGFRVVVEEEYHHFDHELTVVRKGRALGFLFTGRLGTDSYPDSERHRLASAMAARMP